MSDISGTQNTSTPQTIPPTTSTPIVLRVGEKRFYTCEDTISGSAMLSTMVAQRWESHKQVDGSSFVDVDFNIFDYQASYLLIMDLAEWLSKQRYLEAVKIETSAQVVENEEEAFGLAGITDPGTRVQYHPSWRIKKKYVCPRGIAGHYDNPRGCGRACGKALGEAEDQYEECAVLSTLVVKEKVVFHRQVCGAEK
ncbi:MAG: hypothetical protein Q9184_005751 [Pyrenodesmia sp. 2 TL-2023]